MPEWYETAYRGGGPAKPKGFPRPLYPPDHDKGPVPDGPDVVAYKRTICRLGRWGPWDPNQWDNSYSQNFATGKAGTGGDVQWTGVAGFQRQMNLDPTGNIGQKTYDALRYALVPEGRPNAGEQGMDGEAVRLLNQAYDMFNQPPPPQNTLQERMLAEMRGFIGLEEQPWGSNNVPLITDWYATQGDAPWCAMTVTKAGVLAGSEAFVKGQRWAYCPYIYDDALNGRHHLALVSQEAVMPGDLVLFNWSFSGVYDHVGMFEKWIQRGVTFQTIEGNIDSQCGRHTRTVGAQGLAYVHVRA